MAVAGTEPTVTVFAFNELTKSLVKFDEIKTQHKKTLRHVSFSPDGDMLAVASFDSTCTVYKQVDDVFECIGVIEGHENEVKCVEWCSNGRWLATCSRDKSFWVWEFDDDNGFYCAAVVNAHSADVKSIKWIPHVSLGASSDFNGCCVVSTSYDNTVRVWKPEEMPDDLEFLEYQKVTVG